jgi:hypothetical protein
MILNWQAMGGEKLHLVHDRAPLADGRKRAVCGRLAVPTGDRFDDAPIGSKCWRCIDVRAAQVRRAEKHRRW